MCVKATKKAYLFIRNIAPAKFYERIWYLRILKLVSSSQKKHIKWWLMTHKLSEKNLIKTTIIVRREEEILLICKLELKQYLKDITWLQLKIVSRARKCN